MPAYAYSAMSSITIAVLRLATLLNIYSVVDSELPSSVRLSTNCSWRPHLCVLESVCPGVGILPEKLGGGVRPAS